MCVQFENISNFTGKAFQWTKAMETNQWTTLFGHYVNGLFMCMANNIVPFIS